MIIWFKFTLKWQHLLQESFLKMKVYWENGYIFLREIIYIMQMSGKKSFDYINYLAETPSFASFR